MEKELPPIKREGDIWRRKSVAFRIILVWDVYYTSGWSCQVDQVLYKSGVWGGSLCWSFTLESYQHTDGTESHEHGQETTGMREGLLQHESSGWWGRSSERDWKGEASEMEENWGCHLHKWEKCTKGGNGQLCKLRPTGQAGWKPQTDRGIRPHRSYWPAWHRAVEVMGTEKLNQSAF